MRSEWRKWGARFHVHGTAGFISAARFIVMVKFNFFPERQSNDAAFEFGPKEWLHYSYVMKFLYSFYCFVYLNSCEEATIKMKCHYAIILSSFVFVLARAAAPQLLLNNTVDMRAAAPATCRNLYRLKICIELKRSALRTQDIIKVIQNDKTIMTTFIVYSQSADRYRERVKGQMDFLYRIEFVAMALEQWST